MIVSTVIARHTAALEPKARQQHVCSSYSHLSPACLFAWLVAGLNVCQPVSDAGLGAATLAAHTVVKNIVDYANNIFGTFSTVAQSLVASELGKVIWRSIHCLLSC